MSHIAAHKQRNRAWCSAKNSMLEILSLQLCGAKKDRILTDCRVTDIQRKTTKWTNISSALVKRFEKKCICYSHNMLCL